MISLRIPVSSLLNPSVSLCHNLRPLRRGSGLEIVGNPRRLGLSVPLPGGRLLPGGSIATPDGRNWLFIEHDGLLKCHDGAKLTALPAATGKPCGIVSCGDRYLVMMGQDAAPMWLRYDGGRGWTWRSAASLPQPLAMIRKDEGSVSVTAGGINLRDTYSSRSNLLTERDRTTVGELIGKAYRTLASTAANRRVWFQPVIARYRLCGLQGETLYTSPPVMIGPASGPQLTETDFILSGSGFATLSEEKITVNTFRIALRPCAPLGSDWHDVVGSVELLVSPQLHPYDGTSDSAVRFGSFTATAGVLRVFTPGVNDLLTAHCGEGSRLRTLTEQLLGKLDTNLRPIGSVRFDASAGEWAVEGRAFGHPLVKLTDELTSLAALARTVEAGTAAYTDRALAALANPHCICGSVAGECGDTLGFAGIAAMRFKGWLPCEFAVGTADSDPDVPSAGPVAVKVNFTDGSSCVRGGTVNGFPIGELSPLITYPAADAVSMELYYDTHSLHLPLSPDPSGRFAYWLSGSGAAVRMTAGSRPSFILPAESPRSVPFPGLVVASAVSDPLMPLAATALTEENPVSLCATQSATGGWDAGSSRFYLLGSSGIHALTLNSGRRSLTARIIDSRPVGCRDAVCESGDGAILALAGGDLVRIAGQKVTTRRSFVGAWGLAMDAVRGEIICFHSSENPCPENFSIIEGRTVRPLFPDAVVTDLQGRMLYSRSVPAVRSLLTASGRMLALDSSGQLHDFSGVEEGQERVEVYYRASASASVRMASRSVFDVRLFAIDAIGRMEIRGDNCGDPLLSDLLTSFEVRGDIRHLPPLTVMTPHRHNYVLNLHLQAVNLSLLP